jgi:transcriptional regulator CtsR
MTEWHEESERFFQTMEDSIENHLSEEEFEEMLHEELEQMAIDKEAGEEIDEMLADQMLEDAKLAENGP